MKRTKALILIVSTVFLLTGCKKNEETKPLIPPEDGTIISFQTSNLIYSNDGSTSYSLGDIDNTFTFSNDTLTVEDSNETHTYQIAYNKIPITTDDFTKQITDANQVPDLSKYKEIYQYDLCAASNDTPGFRLYVLDDEYWVGTLYGTRLWRIASTSLVE